MNTLYPDATPEELQLSDNICIICREDMVSSSKKLPCGHIFHTICLRSWFQRQQTCPTCRLNILRTPVPAQSQPINAAAVNNGGGVAAAGGGNQQPPVQVAPAAGNATGVNNNNVPPQQQTPPLNVPGMLPPPMFNFPMLPGGMMAPPPMPPPPPFMMPPPPMPQGLDRLSDEELRLLEGTERRNVEERIKFLRNVQTLLDASSALMGQYSAISLQYPIPQVVEVAGETAEVVTPVTEEERRGEVEREEEGAASSKEAVDGDEKTKLEDKVTIRDVVDDEEEGNGEAAGKTPPSPSSPNDEYAEVRRRRLERFSTTNAN